jgi:trans-aconitate 2-methyltransferase
MSNWNAAHYLKFGDERTRPAADLAAQIRLENPREIVDLGCGPGNSTRVVQNRWPQAKIVGVDSSAAMIDEARLSAADIEWQLADIATWQPARTFDLVFSNAALQWLPDHGELMPRLFSFVAPGGALAFQVPSKIYATVTTLILEISCDPAWTDRMDAPRNSLSRESPEFYYDCLVGQASKLDIWETEYQHVLASPSAIIDWMASTGLRPYLAALNSEEERTAFLSRLQERVDAAYSRRVDGKVLFPFRRTFLIAYR